MKENICQVAKLSPSVFIAASSNEHSVIFVLKK